MCLGTYECVATKDYCRDSKEPQAPGIIFAIDVSYPMMKEGVVQLICANMKKILKENLPRDTNCDQVLILCICKTIKTENFRNIIILTSNDLSSD